MPSNGQHASEKFDDMRYARRPPPPLGVAQSPANTLRHRSAKCSRHLANKKLTLLCLETEHYHGKNRACDRDAQ